MILLFMPEVLKASKTGMTVKITGEFSYVNGVLTMDLILAAKIDRIGI